MFEDYISELNSDMTPEQADSLNERYRTGLEAIHDFDYEPDIDPRDEEVENYYKELNESEVDDE